MRESFSRDSFFEQTPSKGLSYHLGRAGEAVITTDHGITLNSLIPSHFFIQHNPDLPLLQSAINNGDILEINLDEVLRTSGFGRAILAHELGHCEADDISLGDRRDMLAREVVFGKLPLPERLPTINRVAQIDIQRELTAWDNAVPFAKLMGVTKEEFELMKSLGLDSHYYEILKKLKFGISHSINQPPDLSLAIFDPYSLSIKEMTVSKLRELVENAESIASRSKQRLAALLRI